MIISVPKPKDVYGKTDEEVLTKAGVNFKEGDVLLVKVTRIVVNRSTVTDWSISVDVEPLASPRPNGRREYWPTDLSSPSSK